MAYIPPSVLEDTEFPNVGCGRDLQTISDLLIEKWQRSFPIVDYYRLLKTPTEATPAHDYISGVAGETQVDDLWGEDIPQGLTAEWVQPHGDTAAALALDATAGRIYGASVQVNAALDLQPSERTLKKIGLDQAKGVIVTIPTPLLDLVGITCRGGDYFIWRGEKFEVLNWHDRGYFYNTNVYLYMVLDCNRQRIGS